jgi:hypothetical protein
MAASGKSAKGEVSPSVKTPKKGAGKLHGFTPPIYEMIQQH